MNSKSGGFRSKWMCLSCTKRRRSIHEFFKIREFFQFFLRPKKCMNISKNERNVTNFGYDYVTIFHIPHKNFASDWATVARL